MILELRIFGREIFFLNLGQNEEPAEVLPFGFCQTEIAEDDDDCS